MCVLLRAQGRAAAVVGQTWPRAMLPTDFSHAPPMRGAMGALGLAVLRLGAILVVEDDEGCAVGDYFRVSAPAWAPLDTVDTWPTSRAMLWPRVKLRMARGAQEKPRKRPQQPHMVMYQCGCCVGNYNRCWDAWPRAAAAARAARGCYRAQRMDYAKRGVNGVDVLAGGRQHGACRPVRHTRVRARMPAAAIGAVLTLGYGPTVGVM